mgnify:CR=1 FL=1
MPNSRPLNQLLATEALAGMEAGDFSSEELTAACLTRIEAREETVQAWVHIDPDQAMAQALVKDTERDNGATLGPLHGIPLALKDIFDTHDMPTENGSNLYAGRRPAVDAFATMLLRQAGAVILGKAVTTEIALMTPNKTKNPHDPSRTPGGSSSGSAAAVASLMAPLSIGSQTGGSVIRPASYCGVVGYKPTYGLISRNGVLKTSEKLDHIGMFGKTVEDVALLAKVLIKKDKFDSATVDYSADGLLEETKKGPLFEPKFIFYKTDYWKNVEKKSREAFEYFIKSFKNNIEIFDAPSYFKDIHKYHQIIYETDLANNFGLYYKKYKKELSKPMQDAIVNGNKHSAKEYAKAIDFMKTSYESHEEVFKEYHGVLSPSSPGVAPKSLKSTGSAEFNRVWSYLGTPCISLPLLKGESEMPLGVQLIGAKFDDHKFLGLANWLEKKANN